VLLHVLHLCAAHSCSSHVHVITSRAALQAVRNFVQLCLEGYYDNTIFHRIIKGFMMQGGDPSGTGEGGASAAAAERVHAAAGGCCCSSNVAM
jgi:cyclophilin family peptidyl-prolyl cis-trans isomerase